MFVRISRSWLGLILLLVFQTLSLLAFATLGLHREWFAGNPVLSGCRNSLFAIVAQTQLYLSLAALSIYFWHRWQYRWLPAAMAVFVVSLAVEYYGACRGLPFGTYVYSPLLGYSIGGKVPLVVPLNWFAMGLASYLLSATLLPSAFCVRQIVTAAFLLSWDLALDPAMSHVTHYWHWQETGAYYGVPWLNFVGWLVTGVLISLTLEFTLPTDIHEASPRWIACYYGVNILLPYGMLLAAGLWPGCAVSIAAVLCTCRIASALGGGGKLAFRDEGGFAANSG